MCRLTLAPGGDISHPMGAQKICNLAGQELNSGYQAV